MRKFIVCVAAVIALGSGAIAATQIASRDTRTVSDTPTEIYGAHHGAIVLRIGNDNAGSSGLLRALANDYLATHNIHGAIAWYQDSDANALAKLHGGHVDMAIVTNKRLIDEAMARNAVTHPSEVFFSRAVLVGPKSNPAHIYGSDSITAALRKIARFGTMRVAQGGAPIFLSRDDHSASNEKERELWTKAGLTPWVSHDLWYRCDHVFARRALTDANRETLYTLSDQATWRAVAKQMSRSSSYIANGREMGSPNIVVLRPFPSKRVRAFLAYLQSDRAQTVIARYTK